MILRCQHHSLSTPYSSSSSKLPLNERQKADACKPSKIVIYCEYQEHPKRTVVSVFFVAFGGEGYV
jgi:hypothetical protein